MGYLYEIVATFSFTDFLYIVVYCLAVVAALVLFFFIVVYLGGKVLAEGLGLWEEGETPH